MIFINYSLICKQLASAGRFNVREETNKKTRSGPSINYDKQKNYIYVND